MIEGLSCKPFCEENIPFYLYLNFEEGPQSTVIKSKASKYYETPVGDNLFEALDK